MTDSSTFKPWHRAGIFAAVRGAYARRYEPESAALLARVLWRCALALSLALTLVGIVYGAHTLSSAVSVMNAANTPAVQISEPESRLRASFDAVSEGFDARAERFEQLRANAPSLPDPSR